MPQLPKTSSPSLLPLFLMLAFCGLTLGLPLARGESPLDFGLDLSGGVRVTYRPDFESRAESFAGVPEAEILTRVKETLSSRLTRSLATVPDVVVRDDQSLVVSLPGEQDTRRVLEIVGKTYRLSFRLVRAVQDPQMPNVRGFAYQGRTLELEDSSFSGDMLDERHLRVETSEGSGLNELPSALVGFRFAPPHDAAFAEFTRANVGRELAILLDDEVEWSGTIESEISGPGVLRGSYGLEEATEIATMLRSGSLPISLELESLEAVGPSLGEAVKDLGWKALLASFGLLAALVGLAYLHRGVLLFCGLLTLGCLLLLMAGLAAAFGLTLDAVGIAGLILSVGMGMDAFILVFESLDRRLVELPARRLSGSADGLVRRLYSFADQGRTLFHANATTLIVILLLLTSERLRSFALFMMAGMLASVLTIVVTRSLLRRSVLRRSVLRRSVLRRSLLRWSPLGHPQDLLNSRGPDLLAWLRHRRLGLYRLRKAYGVALVVALLGVGVKFAAAPPGEPLLALGADFKPGIQVVVGSAERAPVAVAAADLERAYPGVDVRLQQLGSPEAGRFLVTVGAILEATGAVSTGAVAPPLAADGLARIPADALEAFFADAGLAIESLGAIDSKVSAERLLGGLSILVLSFFFLAVYLVALQEPINRFFAPRRRSQMGASARMMSFWGVLLAVLTDVGVMLMAAALFSIPISLPVLAAMLTIIGYSINDSVVLWSHVQDHSASVDESSPRACVAAAVDRIASRAFLTSLSTMVPALTILAVGLTPLADFAKMMIVGTLAGTFSSLFIVGSFAERALQGRGFAGSSDNRSSDNRAVRASGSDITRRIGSRPTESSQ